MSLYCSMSSPVNCFVFMCSDCVALQVGNVFLGSLLKYSAASLFNHFYIFLDSFVHTVIPDIFVKPIHFFQLLKSLLDFIYINQSTSDCIVSCCLSIYNDVQLRTHQRYIIVHFIKCIKCLFQGKRDKEREAFSELYMGTLAVYVPS